MLLRAGILDESTRGIARVLIDLVTLPSSKCNPLKILGSVNFMTKRPHSWLLPVAILAVLLAGGFTIDNGVQWFWADRPWAGALLFLLGIALGASYIWTRTRRVHGDTVSN